MSIIRNTFLSAAAAAALIAPAASAWEDGEPRLSTVLIEQDNTHNLGANTHVDVPGEFAGDAVAASTAVANTAAGLLKSGDIDFDAFQSNSGHVGANSSLHGGNVFGTAAASTTAYGNAASGGTWMGNTFYRAEQDNDGDITATTDVELYGATDIAVSTTGIANVSTPSSEFGDNRAFTRQQNNASVYSGTTADVCCNENNATYVTTAGGNAVSSTGSSSTVFNGAVQVQDFDTTIHANANIYQADGNNVVSAATASANSYTLHNEFGYATLGRDGSELFQANGAEVLSESYVTLDHWSGHASSTAYGVGNSALISNVGSDTALFANQENFGSVTSSASLEGNSMVGGTGIVNATSIGNAASAFLCNTCGDAVLSGTVNQLNSGNTYANTYVNAPVSGGIFGSASAIGNSASFHSSGSD